MKRPIAILFANLKSNIGDFAILHAMLRDLDRRFPGHPLKVFSHAFHPVDEERLADFRAACAIAFELEGRTYMSTTSPKIVTEVARFLRLWHRYQKSQIKSLMSAAAEDAAKFRGYEAVFFAGGDHWGGTQGSISMFGTLETVHRENDRIYAFPFSMKPRVTDFSTKAELQRRFGLIRPPLIARDGITKSVLDNLGIASVLGADCVFSMQDLADEVRPAEGRDTSRVLLALTGSRNTLRQDLQAALTNLSPMRSKLALLTTCEIEDGRDFQAMAREFGIPYHAPGTWQETVAEIKSSSLLVTNRLHGLILGSLAETALLPVTNRSKAEAFARDADMPFTARNARSLTPELLQSCAADGNLVVDRMNAYKRRALSSVRSPMDAA